MSIFLSFFFGLVVAFVGGCSDDGGGSSGEPDGGRPPENTGSACETVDDCFADIDAGALSGDPLCLDRVRNGYCTHLCQQDDDCCAVEGECETDFTQVCAPFESTGQMMCFLSCEPDNLPPAPDGGGVQGEQIFCQTEAGPQFECRSTGGGAQNRKVCLPVDCGVGATCSDDSECDGDLECLTAPDGGYCSVPDCQGDADCPGSSVCVEQENGNTLCMNRCPNGAPDCSQCRGQDLAATCTSDVDFVEASGVSVCAP